MTAKWIDDACPQCKKKPLAWETEHFRDEEGYRIELLVECRNCKAEVAIRYEVCEEPELVEA